VKIIIQSDLIMLQGRLASRRQNRMRMPTPPHSGFGRYFAYLLNSLDCPVHCPVRGGAGDHGHQADLRKNGGIAENAD
jgi:hypothetical protein